jgi:hypothetical protein
MVFMRLISAPTLLTKLFRKTTSLSAVKTCERRMLKAKQLLYHEQEHLPSELELLTRLLNAPKPRQREERTPIEMR